MDCERLMLELPLSVSCRMRASDLLRSICGSNACPGGAVAAAASVREAAAPPLSAAASARLAGMQSQQLPHISKGGAAGVSAGERGVEEQGGVEALRRVGSQQVGAGV